MENTIEVVFPGGKKVDAKIEGRVVQTDQSADSGGEGTAPEPFHLFLVSIAACAGIYALNFCEARDIPSKDMALTMSYEFNEKKGLCEKMTIALKLPAGFPEKYKKAVVRTMDLCSVKRNILHPPEFVIDAE